MTIMYDEIYYVTTKIYGKIFRVEMFKNNYTAAVKLYFAKKHKYASSGIKSETVGLYKRNYNFKWFTFSNAKKTFSKLKDAPVGLFDDGITVIKHWTYRL